MSKFSENLQSQFGENLKRRREELGVSREELATDTGISYNSIYKYEKNISFPRISVMLKLAKSLKCTIDYLLGKSESQDSEELFDDPRMFEMAKGILNLSESRISSIRDFYEFLKWRESSITAK
ncbi:helix-turn-helix transcriptional regulator [Candidatus Poribacteria bacterium]|nr:helix-turn-helix transcriptional regulator [Candidatus Poribacteria bacterium]